MEENLPKRKEIRLKNYDYSELGAYFITICTKNKEKLLWKGNVDPLKFDWKLVGGTPCTRVNVILERSACT